jgi:5'-3' exonuclease
VWITENVRSNVNPSYIFLTSVKKYVDMFTCNNIYSVWDKRLIRGVKNYRRLAKQSDYKGNRDVEKNIKVFSHEDATTDLLNALGVKNMYPGILEADDVISWLAKNQSEQTVIVSVDQDMLQLVNETTTVYSPIKDIIIDHENFEDVVGVNMDQFLRYKSMVGDKSDNLPGIDRCGPKTAIKLLNECPDDQSLLQKLGEDRLKPYKHNLEMIDLNKGLEYHPGDVELYQEQYNKLSDQKPDFDKFEQLCQDRKITTPLKSIGVWKNAFGQDTPATLESIVNKLQFNK